VNTGITYSWVFDVGTQYTPQTGFKRILNLPPLPTFTYNPPKLTVTQKADIRISLAPKVTLLLWDIVPFSATLTPYIGASVELNTQNCNPPAAPFASLYYGVNYALSLDPLQVFGATFDFGHNLPLTYNGVIYPKTNLYSTCIVFPSQLAVTPLYLWQTGPWSTCSTTCGTGVQTRSLSCVTSAGAPAPDQ
jgi:hypothetical protein